jgi:hypothetical protein
MFSRFSLAQFERLRGFARQGAGRVRTTTYPTGIARLDIFQILLLGFVWVDVIVRSE